jgi:hypothetical protein
VARGTGTVVKARYSRGVRSAITLAKGHVRYAVHRAHEAGRRQYRELWDQAGGLDKQAAYDRLDRAGPADYVYRLTLSPHPEHQDAGHRLDLQAWTRGTLARLESDGGERLTWFAASHEHPDHRHVHVVLVSSRRLDVRDLRALRQAGDEGARAQQRQRGPEPAPVGGRPTLGTDSRRELGRDRQPGPARPTRVPPVEATP